MKILVTGSRDWDDPTVIRRGLERAVRLLCVPAQSVTLIHGACRGADLIAEKEALVMGMKSEGYPADWTKGRSAGFIRNITMLALRPDLVLGFPRSSRSRGTMHCIMGAINLGIAVLVMSGDHVVSDSTLET